MVFKFKKVTTKYLKDFIFYIKILSMKIFLVLFPLRVNTKHYVLLTYILFYQVFVIFMITMLNAIKLPHT